MWGEHKTTTVSQSKTCLWVYRERPEQRLSPVGITKTHIMAHFGDYSDEKNGILFWSGWAFLKKTNQPHNDPTNEYHPKKATPSFRP